MTQSSTYSPYDLRQIGDYDCGPTALRFLLEVTYPCAVMNRNHKYFITKSGCTKNSGTTPNQMQEFLEQHGFNTAAGTPHLCEVVLPFIANVWYEDARVGHYVVVTEMIVGQQVVYFCPTDGQVFQDWGSFMEEWRTRWGLWIVGSRPIPLD